MLIGNVIVGDKIEITLRKDKAQVVVYMSQVMDIIDDTHMIAAMPISVGYLVRLPLGPAYSFLVFSGSGMIRYDAAITRLYKDGNLNLMEVRVESSGEKEQRRSHFRLHRNLPLKFSLISEKDDTVGAGVPLNQMYNGITKDISGGGIRFVTNEVLPEDAKIRCVLLIENTYFIAIAKLLYTVRFKDAAYKYQYRVKFISVLPEEQERIIQYIFKEQRKQLKFT